MVENSKKQQIFEEKHFVKKELKYKGKFLEFFSYHIQKDDLEKEYDHIDHKGACVIVAKSLDDKIYLVKQWRRSCAKILFELPAGVLENNEEPSCCAQRELQEEIGKKALKLTYLGGFFTAPGFCNEYLHLFLGQQLQDSFLVAEDTEHLDVELFSIDQIMKMIDNQEIQDAKTLCGIFKYLRYENKKGEL